MLHHFDCKCYNIHTTLTSIRIILTYICIYEIFIEAILSNKLVFNMEDSKPKKIISKTSDILDKNFEHSQTMFKNS